MSYKGYVVTGQWKDTLIQAWELTRQLQQSDDRLAYSKYVAANRGDPFQLAVGNWRSLIDVLATLEQNEIREGERSAANAERAAESRAGFQLGSSFQSLTDSEQSAALRLYDQYTPLNNQERLAAGLFESPSEFVARLAREARERNKQTQVLESIDRSVKEQVELLDARAATPSEQFNFGQASSVFQVGTQYDPYGRAFQSITPILNVNVELDTNTFGDIAVRRVTAQNRRGLL